MPLSISKASDRIPHGCVFDYCRRVRELADIYSDKIKIKCGIEIDYHPSVLDEINAVLSEGEFYYILGSSHMHLFIKDYENYSYNDFAAAALENSISAAESGMFSALSHLDMYRFAFDDPARFPMRKEKYSPILHDDLIKELLTVMAKKHMYLEINPHFAESKQNVDFTYPDSVIVETAMRLGLGFSYGSDAHNPSSVGCFIEKLECHPVYGRALKSWEN